MIAGAQTRRRSARYRQTERAPMRSAPVGGQRPHPARAVPASGPGAAATGRRWCRCPARSRVRSTRRNSSRDVSADSRTRSRPSAPRTTCPTARSGGKTPPSPLVTIRSPARTSSGFSTKSSAGAAVVSPARIARLPDGWIVTGTRLLPSVSSRTRAVRAPTPEIRPTRPSPSIAAQPSRMPSSAPMLSRTERRKGEPGVGQHHARHVGQLGRQPDLVEIQQTGVLLLQLDRGLAPGLHLLQLAAQLLVLLVDAGVALEILDQAAGPGDGGQRPFDVRHDPVDQRGANAVRPAGCRCARAGRARPGPRRSARRAAAAAGGRRRLRRAGSAPSAAQLS